jgi:RND family efflux transporter MFP subunit
LAQGVEPGQIRGVVRALNEAAISSDIGTRVITLPFREGDAFRRNDVLIEFECEKLRADVKAVEAERRGLQAAWENSARLYQLRAAGGHEVTMAAAAHDKAAATAEGLQSRVKQCQIFAPFDGRVVDLSVRRHETPPVNQPIIRVLDDSALEIELLLPASALGKLTVGSPFTLKLDETGRILRGEITRVGPSLDIVSQTFKASGRPVGKFEGVLPGMSGSAAIGQGAM